MAIVTQQGWSSGCCPKRPDPPPLTHTHKQATTHTYNYSLAVVHAYLHLSVLSLCPASSSPGGRVEQVSGTHGAEGRAGVKDSLHPHNRIHGICTQAYWRSTVGCKGCWGQGPPAAWWQGADITFKNESENSSENCTLSLLSSHHPLNPPLIHTHRWFTHVDLCLVHIRHKYVGLLLIHCRGVPAMGEGGRRERVMD